MIRYRIKYTLDSTNGCVWVKDIPASSPVNALNQFHQLMQIEKGIKHSSYSIVTMGAVYGTSAIHSSDGDIIDSSFDLPKCANPNLKPEETKPIVQEAWF